jgi:hypothetical protein
MNNYPSPLKLLSFKASMSHQMIHCKSIMTHGQRHHHITLLTTSTISNNSFYIILYCPHCSSHQSSYSSNNSLNISARATQFPEWVCSRNLEDSCCNQSCRMNLGRNRGWALHSVCKPYVQSYLSTFSLGPSCKKKTNKVRIFCRSSYSSNLSSICRTLMPPAIKQS